jgi:hypothetical protein
MKAAKQGYSFFSVRAPGVFIEYELPTLLGQLEPMNDGEATCWEELVIAAKRYGVRIESNSVQPPRGRP